MRPRCCGRRTARRARKTRSAAVESACLLGNHTHMHRANLIPLALIFALTACSGGSSSTSSGGGGQGPGAGPTFHKDVEPILQEKCQSCHAPGKIAPFALMTYAD